MAPIIGRFPLPTRTAYAELADRALLEPFDGLNGRATGRFIKKAQSGREQSYWWFRYTPAKGVRERDVYIGPDDEATGVRVAGYQASQAAARDRADIVRMLRHARLPGPDIATGKLIEELSHAGLFRTGGVLIGTNAYQAYAGMLGFQSAGSALRTGDVDVAQSDVRSVKLTPTDGGEQPLIDILRIVDDTFTEVPGLHRTGRSNAFAASNSELRLELLAPNTGADTVELFEVPQLAALARPLRFLDFLLVDPVDAVVLHGPGIPVRVPDPYRYAVHKLIVSGRRIPAAAAKAAKDIAQAETLLHVQLDDDAERVVAILVEALQRGSHWERDVIKGFRRLDRDVQGAVVTAMQEQIDEVPALGRLAAAVLR